MRVRITVPKKSDIHALKHVFLESITNAFKDDGIYELYKSDITTECEKQLSFVDRCFSTSGEDIFYFVAKCDDKIVGTIAYSVVKNDNALGNDLITQHIKGIDFSNTPEITSVYILPSFQGKGIGNILFKSILTELKQKRFIRFCLDGGYKKSQGFWRYKLGDPDVTLKDFYGEGLDYMIWVRNISDMQI